MKKTLFILLLILSHFKGLSCHGTTLSLISSPVAIGGGKYQTTIKACFAQYTAGSWGGTQNFTFILSGTTFFSFSPATITNNYKAYTTATCAGPNCFMSTCLPISSTATGVMTSATVVTYNTTSSVPAGYPIVPDDNESCVGCPTSFCFNFTFVSNGYPTAISLSGNIEMLEPKICRSMCGFPTNYGSPCNGSYDPNMTITFAILPIELLYFNSLKNDNFNLLEWSTATEKNNDFFTIEKSTDGFYWDEIKRITAAGNSLITLRYTYKDYDFIKDTINYYRLKQTDIDGSFKYFNIVDVDNRKDEKDNIISTHIYDINGVEKNEYNLLPGMYIRIYQYVNKITSKKVIIP